MKISALLEDDWIQDPGDKLGTATCPRCMVGGIISESSGYPITQEFIDAMYEFWFGPDDVDFNPELEVELYEVTGTDNSKYDKTVQLSFTPEAYEEFMKALEEAK